MESLAVTMKSGSAKSPLYRSLNDKLSAPLLSLSFYPRRACKCCCISFLVVLLALYLFMYHAHTVLICPFDHNKHTSRKCWDRSFRKYMFEFIELPPPLERESELINIHTNALIKSDPQSSISSVKSDATSHKNICKGLPLFANDPLTTQCFKAATPADNLVHFSVLLGQRRGGTNWAQYSLETHPRIATLHEITLDWFKSSCTNFAEFGSTCDVSDMIDIVHRQFTQLFSKVGGCDKVLATDPTLTRQQRRQVILVKLEIEQFWTDHYARFADYLYCNDISFIHYRRASSIASFWSYQADSVERFYTGNVHKMLKRPRQENVERAHISELELDGRLAGEYTRQLDTLHDQFKTVLKFYPQPLQYMEFHYEDFIAPSNRYYWDELQAFLGVDAAMDGSAWIVREHPMPCFAKITNWEQVKPFLNGTDSYYACEMQLS